MSVTSSIVLLALSAIHVLSDYDPNISNGSCYYAPHMPLDKSFYPCGNADGGIIPCCEAGDHCLSSLACYNSDHGTTYVAGCSDKEYSDVLCPDKGDYSDRPWTGMINCPDDSANWVLCDDGNGATITSGAPCTCSSQSTAFTDSPTLTSIMFLPAERGDHVTWVTYDGAMFNGNTDLTTSFSARYYSEIAGRNAAPSTTGDLSGQPGTKGPTPASTSRPSKSSPIKTSTSSATVTATAAVNNQSATLTAPKTGQNVGISIGAAGGACILGLLMFFCFRYRRRARQQTVAEVEKPSATSPLEINHNSPGISDPRSPAFSGHKSELSADCDATSTSPVQLAHTISSMTGDSSVRTSRHYTGGLLRPTGISELASDHDPIRYCERTRTSGSHDGDQVYEMPG